LATQFARYASDGGLVETSFWRPYLLDRLWTNSTLTIRSGIDFTKSRRPLSTTSLHSSRFQFRLMLKESGVRLFRCLSDSIAYSKGFVRKRRLSDDSIGAVPEFTSIQTVRLPVFWSEAAAETFPSAFPLVRKNPTSAPAPSEKFPPAFLAMSEGTRGSIKCSGSE